MHLLLLMLLVVSPAFISPEKKIQDLPVLTIIPAKLVDDPFSGGGSPNPAPPPPPQVEPEPPKSSPPRRETPKPKPEPVKPEPVKTEPPKKVEAKVPEKTAPPTEETKPVKPKPKIVPSFKPSSDNSNKRNEEKARQEEAKRIQAERNRILGSIESALSSSTRIEPVGSGGEAFANYAQVVESIYRRAWDPPSELDADLETVRFEVVIARSGKVVRAEIKRRSGNSALDRSIERLRQIQEIAPFPEGTRDLQRTFIIDFNLKAKRFTG
ncbi:MAG: TonB C-terminal domain-containing protein [Verrucomicrobia bacterium]|nr:TonB C-terminal domain-containing protein [Verrucomicrobiota bacterium]